jgi:hypothetical protein
LRHHIQLGQKSVTALRFDHKELGILVMGKGPAHRLSFVFRYQEDAMLFGATVLDGAPVIGGEVGIAPPVGLEGRLIVLQAGDEGQDRRFVAGQPCFADAANDPAP